MYLPLNYEQINIATGTHSPSTIKAMNNRSFWYWERALFERAAYRFDFTLPDNWQGKVSDYFKFCLFNYGFVVISKNDKYGQYFQPCTVSGFDFYYQPVRALISNPAMQADLEIGSECELLKLTPDYYGINDIICFYAAQLSELDNSINLAIINSKFSFIVAAKNKNAAETLKKVMDYANKGEPMVVFDKKVLCPNDPDDGAEPWQVWERNVSDTAEHIEDLLKDRQTILNAYDNEIGIPTIPYDKKERMVSEEAVSREADSQSRISVWLDTMKESIKEVKKLYPDITLDVRLRPLDDIGEEGSADEQRKDNSDR